MHKKREFLPLIVKFSAAKIRFLKNITEKGFVFVPTLEVRPQKML